jgi:two-component system, chemotaxis family, protein-glutamate methylesterase/glutaminase
MTELAAHPMEAIVIGGSAGSLDVLARVLPALAADFALPIAMVLHVPADKPSLLAQILGGMGPLAVKDALDKEPFVAPGIYVAPPDYHLLLERTRHLSLSADDPVLFSRPSIDVLFESAADAYSRAVTGVLLTGASADGARGLLRIKRRGGAARAPRVPSALARPRARLDARAPRARRGSPRRRRREET